MQSLSFVYDYRGGVREWVIITHLIYKGSVTGCLRRCHNNPIGWLFLFPYSAQSNSEHATPVWLLSANLMALYSCGPTLSTLNSFNIGMLIMYNVAFMKGFSLMQINVRFFAAYRELLNRSVISLDVEVDTTVQGLCVLIGHRFPELPAIDRLLVAVNAEYAQPSRVLCEGDEVAMIPPVSGGVE